MFNSQKLRWLLVFVCSWTWFSLRAYGMAPTLPATWNCKGPSAPQAWVPAQERSLDPERTKTFARITEQALLDVKSSNWSTRADAIQSLGLYSNGDKRVPPILVEALKDPASVVHFNAALALANIRDTASAPKIFPLMTIATSHDEFVGHATRALATMPYPGLDDALIKIVESNLWIFHRNNALTTLAMLRNPKHLSLFTNILATEGHPQQSVALTALSFYQDPRSIEAIEQYFVKHPVYFEVYWKDVIAKMRAACRVPKGGAGGQKAISKPNAKPKAKPGKASAVDQAPPASRSILPRRQKRSMAVSFSLFELGALRFKPAKREVEPVSTGRLPDSGASEDAGEEDTKSRTIPTFGLLAGGVGYSFGDMLYAGVMMRIGSFSTAVESVKGYPIERQQMGVFQLGVALELQLARRLLFDVQGGDGHRVEWYKAAEDSDFAYKHNWIKGGIGIRLGKGGPRDEYLVGVRLRYGRIRFQGHQFERDTGLSRDVDSMELSMFANAW